MLLLRAWISAHSLTQWRGVINITATLTTSRKRTEKRLRSQVIQLLEIAAIYYFIIAPLAKEWDVLYLFPYLHRRTWRNAYRHGVRGIPKGVAATSFPLYKTKMAPPLFLVPNFPEIRWKHRSSSFLLIRCQSYHTDTYSRMIYESNEVAVLKIFVDEYVAVKYDRWNKREESAIKVINKKK